VPFRNLDRTVSFFDREDSPMTWTKPEFEVVEVTMEVTGYVARR
jgi:coenzyme PQQ precursor peptide PqqA